VRCGVDALKGDRPPRGLVDGELGELGESMGSGVFTWLLNEPHL